MSLSESAAMREQIRRWRLDPVLFIRMVFKVEPTPQQIPILMDFAVEGAKVAVKAGHGVGKTGLAAWLAIWHVLLFPDSKAAATAPSATQLRDVLMAEIGKWLTQAHPWVRSQLEYTGMRLSLKGAESTQFLTARTARPDKPDALQGLHATHMAFFIEEAFGVADPIFEVARGALSTPNARALLIGNPTATTGYAYNAFHKNSRIWKRHTLSCIDSPLVSKEYVDEMKQEYGEDSDVYKVRVKGEFPSTAINQLIPRDLAEAASKRKYNIQDYHFAPVVLGVDPAWEGDDRTAVYMRQGLVSKKLGSWFKNDAIKLGDMVAGWWREYKADAVFIDIGWGAGTIDYLRSLGLHPIPVNFGGSSTSPEYCNKRTEMWCELRKWLAAGGAIENDEALIDDLVGPEYSFLPNGKKSLERKKDMKARGLKSPDLADSLALTFAAEVRKQTELERFAHGFGGPSGSNRRAITDYDVLA